MPKIEDLEQLVLHSFANDIILGGQEVLNIIKYLKGETTYTCVDDYNTTVVHNFLVEYKWFQVSYQKNDDTDFVYTDGIIHQLNRHEEIKVHFTIRSRKLVGLFDNEYRQLNPVELAHRVSNGIKIDKEDLDILVDMAFEKQAFGKSRWSELMEAYVESNGKYYAISYAEPLTEMSGEREYTDEVMEVWPQEKTIIEYVKTKPKIKQPKH